MEKKPCPGIYGGMLPDSGAFLLCFYLILLDLQMELEGGIFGDLPVNGKPCMH